MSPDRPSLLPGRTAVILAGLVALIVVVVVISPNDGPEPAPASDRSSDTSARAACRHMANVVDDAAAGILTDAEIRSKLREVYDSARFADDREVADLAEDALAAATARDPDRMGVAVREMAGACAPHR